MATGGRRTVYMNIPAVRPEKDESFEERRCLDYLRAYQATGRPPPPCPPVPTDPAQRAALGLPPLFEPLVEVESLTNGFDATPAARTPAAEPNFRPNFLAQRFVPAKVQEYGSDAWFQSIVVQPGYAQFSFEELRLEAYKAGKKHADFPPAAPQRRMWFRAACRVVLCAEPLLLYTASLLLPAPSISQGSPESLQSINSMPPYDQHSFEELRLACMRAGRPLTSPEIVAQNHILRLTV
ncbi:hypothetical protein BD414DRAFT_426771 [Trametes punicea]|nr:hypothetical protein BD414DRAFT_426771 [Trametes punicea]